MTEHASEEKRLWNLTLYDVKDKLRRPTRERGVTHINLTWYTVCQIFHQMYPQWTHLTDNSTRDIPDDLRTRLFYRDTPGDRMDPPLIGAAVPLPYGAETEPDRSMFQITYCGGELRPVNYHDLWTEVDACLNHVFGAGAWLYQGNLSDPSSQIVIWRRSNGDMISSNPIARIDRVPKLSFATVDRDVRPCETQNVADGPASGGDKGDDSSDIQTTSRSESAIRPLPETDPLAGPSPDIRTLAEMPDGYSALTRLRDFVSAWLDELERDGADNYVGVCRRNLSELARMVNAGYGLPPTPDVAVRTEALKILDRLERMRDPSTPIMGPAGMPATTPRPTPRELKREKIMLALLGGAVRIEVGYLIHPGEADTTASSLKTLTDAVVDLFPDSIVSR